MRVVATALFLVSAPVAMAQVSTASFPVNTYTTGEQWMPRVSIEPAGGFVVVWTSNNQDGSLFGAFGQALDVAGLPRGSEFRVNTYTVGDQLGPSIAVSRRGNALAAWLSGTLIQGQLYDRAGAPAGGEFQISADTTGIKQVPDVAARDDGSFIVTWGNQGPDGSGFGARVRMVDEKGLMPAPEFAANAYTTGDQFEPTVAANAADGTFLVVWTGGAPGDGDSAGIFARRFDRAGVPTTGDFLVNTTTTGLQIRPGVSVSRTGHSAVTWRIAGGGSVFARWFDPSSAPGGPDFVVHDSVAFGPFFAGVDDVAHDDEGNFVIVWNEGGIGALKGRRFAADGTRRTTEFVCDTGASQQRFPVVTSDSYGNFVVVHDAVSDGSIFGIRARRFGGLLPRALEVDAGGNGVLEPGETVDVQPSWQNESGQVVSGILGQLTQLSGPPAFAYAIPDAAAPYPTMANHQTVRCVDCYQVQVSNPPVRPAAHVDASALEKIYPELEGQQIRWKLHVGRSFTDVPTASPFYRFVETLLHRGVTGGCAATAYCPGANTSRGQMAVFALVAREGMGYAPPACTTPIFGDVPAASPFCPWVEELARRGVVSGCGGGNYCPVANVTREQMAIFVLRTLDETLSPPACGTPMFGDVPAASPFCRWVEELARRAVISGCGGGNYCPANPVTREQMGVFISVTFGLTLYGP